MTEVTVADNPPHSSIPSTTPADVDHLASYMARLAHHPNMFRYPDEERVVISTFAGQDATFGCSHLDEAWGMVRQRLEAHSPVSSPSLPKSRQDIRAGPMNSLTISRRAQ